MSHSCMNEEYEKMRRKGGGKRARAERKNNQRKFRNFPISRCVDSEVVVCDSKEVKPKNVNIIVKTTREKEPTQ